MKYLLNNPGKWRSQTAYELAPRGSVTPVGPHLLRRYSMKVLLDTCVWGGVQQALSAAGHDVVWTGDWQQDSTLAKG